MASKGPFVEYAGALTTDEILAEMVSELMAALALMARPKQTHLVVRKIRLKLDIVDLHLALLRKIQTGPMEPALEEQLNVFDINLALLKMHSEEHMDELQQMKLRAQKATQEHQKTVHDLQAWGQDWALTPSNTAVDSELVATHMSVTPYLAYMPEIVAGLAICLSVAGRAWNSESVRISADEPAAAATACEVLSCFKSAFSCIYGF